MNDLWAGLLAGVVLMVAGIRAFPDGAIYKGVQIPGWAQYILFVLGLLVACISLRGLLRGEGKPAPPPVYTDEDAAKAKAKLDALYLEEHGVMPNSSPAQPGNHRADEAAGDKP